MGIKGIISNALLTQLFECELVEHEKAYGALAVRAP